MRTVTTLLVCDQCSENLAAAYHERLPALEKRARGAGWLVGDADRCPAHNNVVVFNATKETQDAP